jgi:hypothetical protein
MNVDAKMEVGVEDHGGKAAPSPSAAASAPPHFLCPVSMELMKDPVMVATGHTYDRPSIKRWTQDVSSHGQSPQEPRSFAQLRAS